MNADGQKGNLLYVPNDEIGPAVNHSPFLIQHMFLLMRLYDVMLLHLLQSICSSCFVANLYLSNHVYMLPTVKCMCHMRAKCAQKANCNKNQKIVIHIATL